MPLEGSWESLNLKKVVIGIPSAPGSSVSVSWAVNLRFLDMPPRFGISTCKTYAVDMARNNIVQLALSDPEVTDIIWLDSDVCPQRDALIKLLKHPEPIVSGVYAAKKPFNQIYAAAWVRLNNNFAFTGLDLNKMAGVFPVDVVGMGLCKVDIEIYRRMKPPWYYYELDRYQDGQKITKGYGEDFYFCQKAINELGEKVWLDSNIRATHLGEIELRPDGSWDWIGSPARDQKDSDVNFKDGSENVPKPTGGS